MSCNCLWVLESSDGIGGGCGGIVLEYWCWFYKLWLWVLYLEIYVIVSICNVVVVC